MTLPELIETIIRTPSGGAMTDENKLDRDFVASSIHSVRAEAIANWYEKKGGIHDLWFQTYLPDYTPTLQSTGDCIVRFKCPPAINVAGNRDGYEYVGTDDGFINFPRAGSGGMKAVYAMHSVTNRLGLITWDWSYNEGGYGEIIVKGRKILERIMVKAIFIDPTALPAFREDKDEYPFTPELMPFVLQRLFQLQTKIIVERKADIVSDGLDRNNI